MKARAEVRWGWRVRVGGVAWAAVSAALAVWTWIDPRASLTAKAIAAAMSVVAVAVAVELFVFRVQIDERGLERRSLVGRGSAAWSQIRVALLVETRSEGTTIVHARTLDPAAAFHVLLRADPPARRRWDFNRGMDGFDAALAEACERGLVALDDPKEPKEPKEPTSPASRRLDRALAGLDQIERGVVGGFALLFFLFVASVSLVAGADVSITGDLFVDLGLVALGLLGALWGLSRLLRAIGARHVADADGSASTRVDWAMHAAGLLGGSVLLIWFVPRALAGAGEHGWVEWVLVGMGAFLMVSSIRGWLRGG